MTSAGDGGREQNRASLWTFLLLLAAFSFITWRIVAPYVMALMLGGMMAVLVRPLFVKLRHAGVGPRLASGLVTGGVIVLIVLPFLLFGTLAVRQAVAVGDWATSQSQGLSPQAVFDRLSGFLPIESFVKNPKELEADAISFLQEIGRHGSALFLELAKKLPESLLHLFLACLGLFFFLTDGPRLVVWVRGKIPIDRDVAVKLGSTFKDTSIGVVWASMVAAAVQSVLTSVIFLIMGVPAAALALVATFIFSWVPIVGSLPVWLAGLIFLAVTGSPAKVIVMIVLAVLASSADHFVRPLVLRGRGEMHPLVSLVAIFGGIEIFGLTGVFFGPILVAVVITLLQVWPDVGRRNGLPFPD